MKKPVGCVFRKMQGVGENGNWKDEGPCYAADRVEG